ncbi:protein of unassigned function [Methylobacterium oryzae CBMB20]|uniref:Protein of unassigned function n=1 Tax=Methylobacterium oryzae CBMB20 TaxID=693986 RepID=A0A089NXQ0_9HYPH|nr:protein of unassigned function [Methylobacterium oryzae CBMB20]
MVGPDRRLICFRLKARSVRPERRLVPIQVGRPGCPRNSSEAVVEKGDSDSAATAE